MAAPIQANTVTTSKVLTIYSGNGGTQAQAVGTLDIGTYEYNHFYKNKGWYRLPQPQTGMIFDGSTSITGNVFININEVTSLSTNADLSSLGPIDTFDSSQTTINILVEAIPTTDWFTPITDDSNASIIVTHLSDQDKFEILVTAEDGATEKTYTVNYTVRVKPIITLNGSNPQEVNYGKSYF